MTQITDPDTFFNRFLQVKSVSEGHALIADADNEAQITRLFVQRIIQRARAQREENPVKAREMLDMLAYAVSRVNNPLLRGDVLAYRADWERTSEQPERYPWLYVAALEEYCQVPSQAPGEIARCLFNAAGDQDSVLLDRINLAGLAHDLGQLAYAQDEIKKARALAEQLGDRKGLAHADHLQANLAADTGRLAEAMDAYLRAFDAAQSLNEPKLLTDITLGLGLRHYARGELESASEKLATALQDYLSLNNAEGQAVALSNLGLVYLANGDLVLQPHLSL